MMAYFPPGNRSISISLSTMASPPSKSAAAQMEGSRNNRMINFQRILDRTPCFGGLCPVREKRPSDSADERIVKKRRHMSTKLPQGIDALEAQRQRQSLAEQLQRRVAKAQQEGQIAANLSTNAVARSFEKALFTAARNLQAHLDVSTLDQRLEEIVRKLQTRKKQASSTKVSSSTPSVSHSGAVAASACCSSSDSNPNEAASLSSGSSSMATQICSNRFDARVGMKFDSDVSQKQDFVSSANQALPVASSSFSEKRRALSRSESASTLASSSTAGQNRLQHARLSESDTSIPSLWSRASSVEEQKARVQRAQRQYAHNLIKQAQFLRFSWANQTRCGMALPYKEKLPLQVKQFFFHTKLLKTPGWQLLPPSQIQELIQQAEEHQEAYQSWAAANLPFFQCGEGQSCPLRPRQPPTAPLETKTEEDAFNHSDSEDSFDSTI